MGALLPLGLDLGDPALDRLGDALPLDVVEFVGGAVLVHLAPGVGEVALEADGGAAGNVDGLADLRDLGADALEQLQGAKVGRGSGAPPDPAPPRFTWSVIAFSSQSRSGGHCEMCPSCTTASSSVRRSTARSVAGGGRESGGRSQVTHGVSSRPHPGTPVVELFGYGLKVDTQPEGLQVHLMAAVFGGFRRLKAPKNCSIPP